MLKKVLRLLPFRRREKGKLVEVPEKPKKLTTPLHDLMAGNSLIHPAWKLFLVIVSVLLAYILGPIFFVTTYLPVFGLWQLAMGTMIFRKDLRFGRGSPFSFISGFLCIDNFFTKPKNNEAAVLFLDEAIDLKTVRKRMETVINTGRFPELKMCLTRHMGFYFWGQCESFDLNEQVYECPLTEELDQEGMHKYHDFFTKKPWKQGKPFWEVVTFPQYKGDPEQGIKTAFGLRVHHSLCDGFGFYNLFNAISDNMHDLKLTQEKDPIFSKKWRQETKQLVKDFFRHLPGVLYHTLADVEFNAWMKAENHRTEENYNFAAPIELGQMKVTAKKLGIPLSELVVAAMTGAVREAFLRWGDPLPRMVSALYPLPVPTHSGGMTNDFIPSTMHLPVGISDRKQRLKLIAEDFQDKKASRWVQYYLCGGFGLLQQWSMKSAVGLPACTLALSNISFPQKEWEMFGGKVKHLIIHNEISFHLPMSVVTLGYAGKVWVWIKIRADICKYEEEEVRKVFEDFKKEIELYNRDGHKLGLSSSNGVS